MAIPGPSIIVVAFPTHPYENPESPPRYHIPRSNLRDGHGRVIHDAASVEVWKTRENKIKKLDVLDQNGPQRQIGYGRSLHRGCLCWLISLKDQMTIFCRSSRRSNTVTPSRSPSKTPGLKMIHAGPDLDGLIILRRPRSADGRAHISWTRTGTAVEQLLVCMVLYVGHCQFSLLDS